MKINDVLPGQFGLFACDKFTPKGFTLADGKSLAVADYPEISNLYQQSFGGDTNHFNIPKIAPRNNVACYVRLAKNPYPNSNDLVIGTINMWPTVAAAPDHHLPCDGSILKIDDHQILYTVIGNQFGGDSESTFALPKIIDGDKQITYYICTSGTYPTGTAPGSLGDISYFAGRSELINSEGIWQSCNGSLQSIGENSELFAVLGPKFGGNDRTTFAIPKLDPLIKGVEGYVCCNGSFPERE